MPSSTLRHLGNQPGQPVMQPAFNPSYRPDDFLLGTLSWNAIGPELVGMAQTVASSAWPAANRAIAYPFVITETYLARKVWWVNGTTATTDSADVGVYTEAGALVVSGGGTAIATSAVVQEADCADTLLSPGRYWCAYSQNGTTATPLCLAPPVALGRALGLAQMASAYVLPATFVPAATAALVVPLCGIATRTQVA